MWEVFCRNRIHLGTSEITRLSSDSLTWLTIVAITMVYMNAYNVLFSLVLPIEPAFRQFIRNDNSLVLCLSSYLDINDKLIYHLFTNTWCHRYVIVIY